MPRYEIELYQTVGLRIEIEAASAGEAEQRIDEGEWDDTNVTSREAFDSNICEVNELPPETTPTPEESSAAETSDSLIAAAPELLEELRAAVAAYDDIVSAATFGDPYTPEELTSATFSKGFNRARLVIAEATGGAA